MWLLADSGPTGYSPGTLGLAANGYGTHSPGGLGLGGVLLVEILLTALLVFTVLGATDVRAPFGSQGWRSAWSSPCAT